MNFIGALSLKTQKEIFLIPTPRTSRDLRDNGCKPMHAQGPRSNFEIGRGGGGGMTEYWGGTIHFFLGPV